MIASIVYRRLACRPRFASALLLLLVLPFGPMSAQTLAATDDSKGCVPEGQAIMELQVTAAELAAANKPLAIAVYDNACARISLPNHYRRRGEYVLALSEQQRSHLQALRIEHSAQPYDHQLMLDQSRQIELARSSNNTVEQFEVHDADHYTLTLRDASGVSITGAMAMFQYAERYPQLRALDALQRLSSALISLSERRELVAIDLDETQQKEIAR